MPAGVSNDTGSNRGSAVRSPVLNDLADRYWQFRCAEFPIEALQAGLETDAVVLLRMGPDDHRCRADFARALAGELSAVDRSVLSLDDLATAMLLERELGVLIEMVAVRAHLRPSLFPLGPEFSFAYWAGSVAPSSLADAELFVARLAAIPEALRSIEASLTEGLAQGIVYPRLVVLRALGQVRDQLAIPAEDSAFAAPARRMAAHGGRWGVIGEAAIDAVKAHVYPALAAYADLLQTALLPAARDSIAAVDDIDGEAHYRHLVAFNTTTDLDPDAIHCFGLAEVDRIDAAMRAVASDAGAADLAAFRSQLKADPGQLAPSAEALRQEIESLSKRIDARIPEYFGRIPRSTYGVMSIPEAMSASAPPAYAQPNPADNSMAGIHWVSSLPAKLPRYMHVPLALHEAWPGHLMHLALIQEMEHLPDFRRHGALSYSACLEGWALYCEALGEELGFYDTPEKQYGRLEMEMWRAVRLVVDTGLHTRGWTRDRALELFAEHLALSADAVAAEVDRYIGLPGQALGYQLGNRAFRDARRRAEAALGDRFRLRDFHDALMAAGPVTLPLLDTLIDAWIAAQMPAMAA